MPASGTAAHNLLLNQYFEPPWSLFRRHAPALAAAAHAIMQAAPSARLAAVVFEISPAHGRRLHELLEHCCGPTAIGPDPDHPQLRLAILPLASVAFALHDQAHISNALQQDHSGITAILATRSGIATTVLPIGNETRLPRRWQPRTADRRFRDNA